MLPGSRQNRISVFPGMVSVAYSVHLVSEITDGGFIATFIFWSSCVLEKMTGIWVESGTSPPVNANKWPVCVRAEA